MFLKFDLRRKFIEIKQPAIEISQIQKKYTRPYWFISGCLDAMTIEK